MSISLRPRKFWLAPFVVIGGLGAAVAQTAPIATPTAPTTPTFSEPFLPKVPAPAPQASATPSPSPSPASSPAPTPTTSADGAPVPVPVPTPVAVRPKKVAPPPPPLETVLPNDPAPTLQPDTFAATAKAAERYAAIVGAGGWATDLTTMRAGAVGPAVAALRKHLQLEGDLDASAPIDGPAGAVWDKTLTAAIKHYQSRMGLRETGVVAGATLKALNVPAETRAQELAASSLRLSGYNFSFGERYVVVNLPSTSVEAVENGVVAHRYVAIVGGPEHPSPEIAAHIQVINLNPTWTVPTSIIKKEIIPKMQKNPGYLARQKIRILDGSGKEVDPKAIDWNTNRAVNYTLRQDSGAGNSLGSIRIGMPNKLAVYMHDTPSKRLFGADYRFLSHGCVRVQGVYDYAEWLLQGTPGPTGAWDKAALLAKVKDSAREDIKLTKAVPVIWVYLTGWANNDGLVHFRDDVYGLDSPAQASASDLDKATPILPDTPPKP